MTIPNKQLKKALKHRLRVRKSKSALRFYDSIKPKNHDKCHILDQKLNDYLITFKSREDHAKEHFEKDYDFVEDLISALENTFSYINHLENKLNNKRGR